MLRLILKPEAKNDLDKIFFYTLDKWGLNQAEKYQDELFEGMKLISERPKLGKVYPYSVQEYRMFTVNKHILFYRINSEDCEVIRILHNRMSLKMNLNSFD